MNWPRSHVVKANVRYFTDAKRKFCQARTAESALFLRHYRGRSTIVPRFRGNPGSRMHVAYIYMIVRRIRGCMTRKFALNFLKIKFLLCRFLCIIRSTMVVGGCWRQ